MPGGNEVFLFSFFLGDCGGGAVVDCIGVCGGGANISNDTCNECLLPGEKNVFKDCRGDCHGNATLDDCNVCTGGNTGKIANYLIDACGMLPTLS